jgi:hypothetical protein
MNQEQQRLEAAKSGQTPWKSGTLTSVNGNGTRCAKTIVPPGQPGTISPTIKLAPAPTVGERQKC